MEGLGIKEVICIVILAVVVVSFEIFIATQPMDKIKALGELLQGFAGLVAAISRA